MRVGEEILNGWEDLKTTMNMKMMSLSMMAMMAMVKVLAMAAREERQRGYILLEMSYI